MLTERLFKLLKFGIAGIVTLGVDYGTFYLMDSVLAAPLIVSSALSYSTGFIVSFLINRGWVFTSKGDSGNNFTKTPRRQLVLYSILFLFNIVFSYVFIDYLHKLTGVGYSVGKVISIILIVVWNYIIYHRIIFKQEGQHHVTEND